MRSGRSAPANCPVRTMGLPQKGQADAAMVSSPTISPPQLLQLGMQTGIFSFCPSCRRGVVHSISLGFSSFQLSS